MSLALEEDGGFSDSISEAPATFDDTSAYDDTVMSSPVGSPISDLAGFSVLSTVSEETTTSVKSVRDAMVAAACSIYDIPPKLMHSPLINQKSFRERRKSVRFTEMVIEHVIEDPITPVDSSSSAIEEKEKSSVEVDVTDVPVTELPILAPTETTNEEPIPTSPHRRLHSHPVIIAALQHDVLLEEMHRHSGDHSPVDAAAVVGSEKVSTTSNDGPAEETSSFVPPKLEKFTSRKFMVTVDKVKENNDKIAALFDENNAAIKQAIRDSRVILGNILDDIATPSVAPSLLGSAGTSSTDTRTAEQLLAAKYFLAREALLQKRRTEMSTQTVMDILKNHSELSPYLQHCCADDVNALIADATAVDFSHNETVMNLKDFVSCIYVVLQGSVTIEKYAYEINDETGETVWDSRSSSTTLNHPGSLIGKSVLEGLTQWDCTGINHSLDSLSLSFMKEGVNGRSNSISGNVKAFQENKDYTLSLCAIPLDTVLRYIGLHTRTAKDHALYFWKYTRLYNEITRFNRDYVISSMALTYGKKRRSIVTDYRMMDVMGTAKIRKFPAHVDVFKQGQSRHYLYYLTKGSAKYVRKYPDWINSNDNGGGTKQSTKSIPLPSEIDLELILSRGDYSYMDGENTDWVKHMAKVDETILRSKTENPLLYEHKKRKYSRFEFHKNTLVTMTNCEMISIPISEVVKSMTLFNNLLALTNKKYAVLNISSEDLVLKYYKQQEWLREKAALVQEIMTDKQANKVADFFHCPVASNLNVDYCRRHTPGSAVRPLTASIDSQETAKFKLPDNSTANNSGEQNTARSSGSTTTTATLLSVLKAKSHMHMPAFSNTATSLSAAVAVPEYQSNTIYLAQTKQTITPFSLDTPRPQSASALIGRRSKADSTEGVVSKNSTEAGLDANKKVVFGYGLYTRYVNDVTEVDPSTFFLTSDASAAGGSGSGGNSASGSPRRPLSARSSRPGSARIKTPRQPSASGDSNRGTRPTSAASTFGKSLRFGGTGSSANNNSSLAFVANSTQPSSGSVVTDTKPVVQQRPSSAPSSSSRRFSRPAVARLNFSSLNRSTLHDTPVETKIEANVEHDNKARGNAEEVQLPKHSKERRRGGNLEISNLLDLVYQANELKKRLESEQRDNGNGDGYIYRYKSDFGHQEDDDSSSSSSGNNSVGSQNSLGFQSVRLSVGAHNTSRDEADEVIVKKEEKLVEAVEDEIDEVEPEVESPQVTRPTSSGYGQAPTNTVKKTPDFYAQMYKERLVSNSPKKRFIDEFISKKNE